MKPKGGDGGAEEDLTGIQRDEPKSAVNQSTRKCGRASGGFLVGDGFKVGGEGRLKRRRSVEDVNWIFGVAIQS